jgi:hypothetical protein
MPRPCIVCCRRDRQEIEALLATGIADHEISRRYGIERSAISRHRRDHILKPMAERAALLAKDYDARQERARLAEAAASDSTSIQTLVENSLGMRRQLAKLDTIESRIERLADAAEKSSSAGAAAQLAAQQFRGIETGARLAGLTGYRPVSAPAPPANNRPVFSVNIVFRGAGRTESINVASPPEGPAEIEGAVYEHPISNDTGNTLRSDEFYDDVSREDPGA